MQKPTNPLLVALDTSSLSGANTLVTELQSIVGGFKVGLELITAEGFPAVSAKLGHMPLFVDAKFHDIPNTVAGAIRGVVKPGTWMTNVHTIGGVEMMRAAKVAAVESAAEQGLPAPLVIGVTILTSLDRDAMMQVGLMGRTSVEERVVALAKLAQESGLDGVVASAYEATAIRRVCGDDFIIVTPGVRPAWASAGDQKRVVTPKEAIDRGATYIVVGRPITQPPSSVGRVSDAAKRILEEIDA